MMAAVRLRRRSNTTRVTRAGRLATNARGRRSGRRYHLLPPSSAGRRVPHTRPHGSDSTLALMPSLVPISVDPLTESPGSREPRVGRDHDEVGVVR